MYNSKIETNRERSGCISYVLGERKYFGANIEQILDGKKGYYGNIYNQIQEKMK